MGRKAIIAGGRGYILGQQDFQEIDRIHCQLGPIDEVVSGGATGADSGGETWARMNGIALRRFLPGRCEGRAGGPIRNRRMAEYVGEDGLCILFPGGRGTESMQREAAIVGMKIVQIKHED